MFKIVGVFVGFEGVLGVFFEEFKGIWCELNEGEVFFFVVFNFYLSGNGNFYFMLWEGGIFLIYLDFDIECILLDIEKYKISCGFMVLVMMKFVIDWIK